MLFTDTQNHNGNGYDTLGRALVDGHYIDGSWTLPVLIEDLNAEVTVRVRGDWPLGALMHQITECADLQQSWSDHAIWRRDRKIWLLQNKTTLDQYNIQSDAKLTFRRMHGDLQIMLPSLTTTVVRVSFAEKVFSVVRSICKELNIRHHEELSLTFPITKAHLKSNMPLPDIHHGALRNHELVRTDQNAFKAKLNSNSVDSNHKVESPPANNYYGTLQSGTMMRLQSKDSIDRIHPPAFLDFTSRRTAKDVFGDNWLMKPKNYIHKARLNSGWLDSSRSLLEHGIEPHISTKMDDSPPLLYLCFKYYAFYDLNVKYDTMRIHQLYEQARWSILAGQLDCTEDEMVVFAAYQLQAEMQAGSINPIYFPGSPSMDAYSTPYQTLGPNSTLDGASRRRYAPFGGSLTAVSNPDLLRRQQYYPTASPTFGTLDSTMLRGGEASPMFGNSVVDGHSNSRPGFDDVDELLSELEQSCGVAEELGSTSRSMQQQHQPHHIGAPLSPQNLDVMDTSEIPSLQDNIRVLHGGSGSSTFFRQYKAFWGMVRETRLYLFKHQSDVQSAPPLFDYALRDCCITPQINTSAQKYVIKLAVSTECHSPRPDTNGTNVPFAISANRNQSVTRQDLWLKFETAEQYARWLAACRLGSKGKTLASRVAYEREVDTTLEILRLQVPGPTPAMSNLEAASYLGDLTDFCAERIIRKARSKDSLRQRIMEAHSKVHDLSLTEAKYKYILAWQRLNNFGRTYFIVSLDKNASLGTASTNSGVGGLFNPPSDDMIAICQGRFEIVSPQSGEVIRAWNFIDLRSWNINWDASKVVLEFRNGQLSFRPLSSNCKTICEFIGGYVFLTQRTPEKSQECNERLFHRLTGATDV